MTFALGDFMSPRMLFPEAFEKALQKENQVKIPNPIIDTLNLKVGEPISIILDIQEECIKIRKKTKKK